MAGAEQQAAFVEALGAQLAASFRGQLPNAGKQQRAAFVGIARQAIEKTRVFFEQMGVATRLSAYGLDAAVIPQVVAKLEEHQFVALGEHGDITPSDAAKFLELAL